MARTSSQPPVRASSRERAIVEHLGLVVAVAHSLRGNGVSRPDLVQEGCIALVRTIDSLTARGKQLLESQISRKVRARMLRAIARRRAFREGHVRLSPSRESRVFIQDPFLVLLSAELDAEMEKLVTELSDFDRELLDLRYGLRGEKRCTVNEAGRMLRVRPERIERAEFKAIRRLRRRARRLLPLLRAC